jgi:molybdate transport system ATP-binding protein
MQLHGHEKQRPHELSGGQQQRVALARILIGDPELLLLDEPFSALDNYLREQLQVETQNLLKQFGKDTLLVTHSIDEAYMICDSIALIDNGKVIVKKGTKSLFDDPGSRQAALLTGCKNIVDARKIGEFEVEAPDWGVKFITAMPVEDGVCAIAISSHYFETRMGRNTYPVRFKGEVDEPFERILLFRYENQNDSSPDIWWSIPKGGKLKEMPTALNVAPRSVLPLYS